MLYHQQVREGVEGSCFACLSCLGLSLTGESQQTTHKTEPGNHHRFFFRACREGPGVHVAQSSEPRGHQQTLVHGFPVNPCLGSDSYQHTLVFITLGQGNLLLQPLHSCKTVTTFQLQAFYLFKFVIALKNLIQAKYKIRSLGCAMLRPLPQQNNPGSAYWYKYIALMIHFIFKHIDELIWLGCGISASWASYLSTEDFVLNVEIVAEISAHY